MTRTGDALSSFLSNYGFFYSSIIRKPDSPVMVIDVEINSHICPAEDFL